MTEKLPHFRFYLFSSLSDCRRVIAGSVLAHSHTRRHSAQPNSVLPSTAVKVILRRHSMKLARVVSMLALAYLSLSALWGGIVLIANAHENPWGMMPQSLIRFSPFHSYLIPGIVLLVANGLLALFVLLLVFLRTTHYGLWTVFQGFVLLGWLTIECLMLRVVIWPHYLFGAVALILVTSGLLARHDAEPVANRPAGSIHRTLPAFPQAKKPETEKGVAPYSSSGASPSSSMR